MNRNLVLGGVLHASHNITQTSRAHYTQWWDFIDAGIASIHLQKGVVATHLAVQQPAQISFNSFLLHANIVAPGRLRGKAVDTRCGSKFPKFALESAIGRTGLLRRIIRDGGRDLHRGLALFHGRHGRVVWVYDIKHKTASD